MLFTGLFQHSFSQGVKIGDNPTNLNAGAILELQSNKSGLLLPRLNTVQMNAIKVLSGASQQLGSNGLLVYNIDSLCVCYYDGISWRSLCSLSLVNASYKKSSMTSQGLIKINGASFIDSVVLKPVQISIDSTGLIKLIADSIVYSKKMIDSLAKAVSKSPVKDSVLSYIITNDFVKNTIVKVIKDSVTISKVLKDSIYNAVKSNAKTLSTDGLVLVNGSTSLDSAVLKSVKLTIDSAALAKAVVLSPVKDSMVSVIKKDTSITNNIVKIIKDSVTVSQTLKDSIYNAVKANAKALTTSGLIKVNAGNSLDSSLLKGAHLTVDTFGLTKIIADSMSSKAVLDSLAKSIIKSPLKDSISSIVNASVSSNSLQYTLTATDVNNGYADINIPSLITDYSLVSKTFVSIESDNSAIAVSISRSYRTMTSIRVKFGAASEGDKINLLIVK